MLHDEQGGLACCSSWGHKELDMTERLNWLILLQGFPCGSDGKASAYNARDPGRSLGQEDSLEKEMATHSSILAWKIPWSEEPSRLQSMGLQRVGHNWATSLHFLYFYKTKRAFHLRLPVKSLPHIEYILSTFWKEIVYIWERRHSRIRKEQCQANRGFIYWWYTERKISICPVRKTQFFCIFHSGRKA